MCRGLNGFYSVCLAAIVGALNYVHVIWDKKLPFEWKQHFCWTIYLFQFEWVTEFLIALFEHFPFIKIVWSIYQAEKKMTQDVMKCQKAEGKSYIEWGISCFSKQDMLFVQSCSFTASDTCDLSGGNHFLVYFTLYSAALQEERSTNWMLIQADFALFSTCWNWGHVDRFTLFVLRTSEQSVPWLSTKLCCDPGLWWTGMSVCYASLEVCPPDILMPPYRGKSDDLQRAVFQDTLKCSTV
jgi:hypothetical protein